MTTALLNVYVLRSLGILSYCHEASSEIKCGTTNAQAKINSCLEFGEDKLYL